MWLLANRGLLAWQRGGACQANKPIDTEGPDPAHDRRALCVLSHASKTRANLRSTSSSQTTGSSRSSFRLSASTATHTNPGLLPIPTDDADTDADATKNKNQWLGYCTHGTVLFPTWHRPYILALESHAAHLASLYTTPDAPSWCLAAQSLRMPYWDWALHPLLPPEVIECETLWTRGRNFVFSDGVRGEGFPKRFRGWRETVRWPMSCEADAKSDGEALKSRSGKERRGAKERARAAHSKPEDGGGELMGEGITAQRRLEGRISLKEQHGMIASGLKSGGAYGEKGEGDSDREKREGDGIEGGSNDEEEVAAGNIESAKGRVGRSTNWTARREKGISWRGEREKLEREERGVGEESWGDVWEGLSEVAGMEEKVKGVEKGREGLGDEDRGSGKRQEETEIEENVEEEAVKEGTVILLGDVDTQPHLAPLPLPLPRPLPHPSSASLPASRPSTQGEVDSQTRRASFKSDGDRRHTSYRDYKRYESSGEEKCDERDANVGVGWTACVKVREFDVGGRGGESVESLEDKHQHSSWSKGIAKADITSTATDGLVVVVSSYVHLLLQWHVAEVNVPRYRDNYIINSGSFDSERSIGLRPLRIWRGDVAREHGIGAGRDATVLREPLRWGVWTNAQVSNNTPIPHASLAPGAVEDDRRDRGKRGKGGVGRDDDGYDTLCSLRPAVDPASYMYRTILQGTMPAQSRGVVRTCSSK
ncbi:common central domain of tyrosinase-domain-containing protein [Irpex lacteus]|nr:common central domain of tyrosinase-domain-containing protein [Irpex lacteus]